MDVPSLTGLKRALARDVPTGYEEQAAWTARTPGVHDQTAIQRLYAQREADRIAAQNTEASARMALTGEWEPWREQAPGADLQGLTEGMFYNDTVRGIGPTGDIEDSPRSVQFRFPTDESLQTLQRAHTRAARVVDVNPQTASFSLQGLRDIARSKETRKRQQAENTAMLAGGR
mgnify:FL=1